MSDILIIILGSMIVGIQPGRIVLLFYNDSRHHIKEISIGYNKEGLKLLIFVSLLVEVFILCC